MQFLNGTRLGSLLQTLLYITGVPLQQQTGTDFTTSIGAKAIRGLLNSNDQDLAASGSGSPYNYNYTKCYGILGCIRMKYPRQRGFELFPQEMSVIRPSVCLYVFEDSRCQPVEPDDVTIRRLLLNVPSESDEGVGSDSPTSYWVTHGYLENGHRAWLHEMAIELVMYDRNANVFVVDWGRGAEPPYTQAATNIELVGAYVGFLMTLVEDLRGLKTSSAHFIGHSLGAHMGGVVGSWLRLRGYVLGRISGMDPAQPYFELFPPDARLDASDALFVDVIHTDATPLLHGGTLTGLGTQEPCGHIDFYPNAGKDQPGCNDGVMQAIVQEKGSFLYGLRRFFGCNHIRAVEYFMESIRSNCSFNAYACESYDALERGDCTMNCTEDGLRACNRMGFHAKKPTSPNGQPVAAAGVEQSWRTGDGEQVPVRDSVLYYSMTGTRAPYCRDHYTLNLTLGAGTVPIPPGISTLSLSILAPGVVPSTGTSPAATAPVVLEEFTVLEDTRGRGLRTLPLSPLTYKYTFAADLGPTGMTDLEIRMRPTLASPLSWLAVALGKQYKLGVDFVEVNSIDQQLSPAEGAGGVKFCPNGGRTRSVVNLADPKSQLVLTPTACAQNIEPVIQALPLPLPLPLH